MSQSFGRSPNVDSKIMSYVESKIATAKIFVVSKIKCPACVQAKDLLRKLGSKTGVLPEVFELHNYSKQQIKTIIKHLSAKTGIKTVPQIFIRGRFIGGNDDIHRIHNEGRLVSLIGGWTNLGAASKSNSTPFLGRSRANKEEVFSTPVKREDARKYLKLEPSRSAPFYRPTYTKVDDNKWDMPSPISQSQKLIIPPVLQKSNSYNNMGINKPNDSWKNRQIQSTRRSVVRTQQVNIKVNWSEDEAILNEPAVCVFKRSGKEKGCGDLISFMI